MIPLDQNKIINFKSGLYVVSTPIGNLMDITLRSLGILNNADLIIAEDTRITQKLLSHYQIRKSIISNSNHLYTF